MTQSKMFCFSTSRSKWSIVLLPSLQFDYSIILSFRSSSVSNNKNSNLLICERHFLCFVLVMKMKTVKSDHAYFYQSKMDAALRSHWMNVEVRLLQSYGLWLQILHQTLEKVCKAKYYCLTSWQKGKKRSQTK